MSRYPDRPISGQHDYQYNRNDPYRRKEDPYSRNIDPYKRNDDPYKRSDDPYRRNDDPYRRSDDINHDDPYGKVRRSKLFEEDPYSRKIHDPHAARPSRDGFHSDSYKSSGDMPVGYNFKRPEPVVYEVDHLVTFDVSPKLGVKTHKDGMERLKHMEMTSGVWTMRYLVSIDDREIVVTEKATRKELECFPISRVRDPVNITSNESEEVYNNIVIFVVDGESSRDAPEMHIFQCIGKQGQELIDDIEAACTGKFPRPPKEKRSSVSSQEAERRQPPVPYNGDHVVNKPPSRASNRSSLNELAETDIELLNRCFDSIESFVGSLQNAATAQKKLEEVKSRGNADENEIRYLVEKARPPPAREFIETFQKFKFALNLLPKLKYVLKDPNAQELTHLLFAPLQLVVEASRDPHGMPKLGSSVTAPLLTNDTCILLDTSLHAHERTLWRQLGDPWNIPEQHWKEPVPPYIPRFINNSKPARLQDHHSGGEPARHPLPHQNGQTANGTGGAHGGAGPANPSPSASVSKPPETHHSSAQEDFHRTLKARNAKVYRVIQSRVSKNPAKELTVSEGEYVEVLDSAKKWWKVVNIRNESGFVPSTILTQV